MNQQTKQAMKPILAKELECTAKAVNGNQVDQLVEYIAMLNKRVGELSCMLEPILLPVNSKPEQGPRELEPTSPLMERVRDAGFAVEDISNRIRDLIERVRY